ncbi:MAG: hypothetical protein OXC44_03685 [Proteobacteria bacterium]|nr:hypothetical protein [Pseudomonadota bacterium]
MIQSCSGDDSTAFPFTGIVSDSTKAIVIDPPADEPDVPPKTSTQLPNSPTKQPVKNFRDERLNNLRDKVANDHCINGTYGTELRTSLGLLKCRTEEQDDWLDETIIYSRAQSNSCITHTSTIKSDILEFVQDATRQQGIEGWQEYQCKKAADAALKELNAQRRESGNNQVTEEQLVRRFKKMINKFIAWQSKDKTHNIKTIVKYTLYNLNNNCAEKVITEDFSEQVSQTSENNIIKPSYRFLAIKKRDDLPTRERLSRIDNHVQRAWHQIHHKIKAYQRLVGSQSGTSTDISKFSGTSGSLTQFLGYNNVTDYPVRLGIVAMREIKTRCLFKKNAKDDAYTKFSIESEIKRNKLTIKPIKTKFFDHNNYHYKKSNIEGSESCATEMKIVLRYDPTTHSDGEQTNVENYNVHHCRIIKGYNYTNLSALNADSSGHVPEFSTNPPTIARKKNHDAITCYKKVTKTEKCGTNTFDSHHTYRNAVVNQNFLNYIHTADDNGVKAQKRDLVKLNLIKRPLLERRNLDLSAYTDTLEEGPRPYSVYFPNESQRFVKVGGLVMDIDLHDTSEAINTAIPCPTSDNKWNSDGVEGKPRHNDNLWVSNQAGDKKIVTDDMKFFSHKGCISSTPNNYDYKKTDTKYYWDFPDDQREVSPVCVYFMFINVDGNRQRKENQEAIKKVFGLNHSNFNGEICSQNPKIEYKDKGDFCNQSRQSLKSQELRDKHQSFCDADA